ncbi:hypothetical protein MKX54_04205 [Alkalihalobacillus sp. FSL R5-0424]
MVYLIIGGLLTAIVVFADVLDFRQDQKRWGWFKSWSKPAKLTLFVGITLIFTVFWTVVSLKYV